MTNRAVFLFAICLPVVLASPSRGQTQADMDKQAGQAFKKADAALNQTYDQLVAKVSPAGKEALRQAQRTWLQFRDQECAFETFGSRDGSVHPMVLADCAAAVTAERTKQLRAQLECPEGDAGCGGQ